MRSIFASRDRLIVPSFALDMTAKRNGKLVDLSALGMFPQMAGGAEGFNQVGDVVTETADGRDLNQVWADFRDALALYNAERDRLMAVLSFGVTQAIEDVFQGGDTVNFERASEFGVPRGIRAAAPNYFSLAYDFDWWDLAIRYTWMYLAESTAAQLDSLNNQALEADNRLLFVEVMRAIFSNTTRAATIRGNNFNVYPLYNADGTVPPAFKGVTPASPHNHYLVSGAATVTSGDLDEMETHLRHHGYSWQEGSALIMLVNSEQMATIRTFRVEDGDSYDFIQAAGIPAWALTAADMDPTLGGVSRAAPPSAFNGLTVTGRYGPWLIVEDDLITAKYMLGFASGGTEDARNLVGIREHANQSLRGLRLVKGPDPDYPLVDSYYQRGFGTGIRQRGAGVVMQIKASGAYAIPAAYA